MSAGEFFGKYVGVQGVLAIILVIGYVAAPFAGVTLPPGYSQITTGVIGMGVQKTGSAIVANVRNRS